MIRMQNMKIKLKLEPDPEGIDVHVLPSYNITGNKILTKNAFKSQRYRKL
jgi:hypothetical protein